MQNMRQQQRYLSKLEKISQTSSPSKEQQSPIQTASIKSRINPASLTTSYLKFKRFQQEKQKKTFNLQASLNNNHLSNHFSDEKEIESNLKTDSIQDKNQRISSLQEMIVRKKMELNSLQQSYQSRINSSQQQESQQEFKILLKNTLKICQKSKMGRNSYLQMVFNYKRQRKTESENCMKFLVEWVLKVTRQILSSLTGILKIPIGNSE